jgi:protein-L-isoaspartate O-methyltransferase
MEQRERAFIRTQYETDANLRARIALHAQYSTNRLGWHNWIWQQLALAPGEQVLEVGCGPVAACCSQTCPTAWSTALADRSGCPA